MGQLPLRQLYGHLLHDLHDPQPPHFLQLHPQKQDNPELSVQGYRVIGLPDEPHPDHLHGIRLPEQD